MLFHVPVCLYAFMYVCVYIFIYECVCLCQLKFLGDGAGAGACV